jgi:FlaA1/EpsC-like NDP-sugar epimerase
MAVRLRNNSAGRAVRLRRGVVWAGADALAWALGLTSVTLIRYEFAASAAGWRELLLVIGCAIVGQWVLGSIGGLYTGRHRLASFEEAGVLGFVDGLVGVGLILGLLAFTVRPIPLSAAAGGSALAALFAFGFRYLTRLVEHRRAISGAMGYQPTIVFGAGEAGYEAARSLLRDRESPLRPVAFLDDDPAKQNLRILGCQVMGGSGAIARAAAKHQADTLLIAMPSAERAEVAAVAREARQAGLKVLILPRMVKYLESDIVPRYIRPLDFADFLGRKEVRIDPGQVAALVEGRRVLVTGAGGSIGSELCSALSQFRPGALFMLDRDENALQRLQLRLEGRALLDSDALIVADVRDAVAVEEAMQRCRPEVVFHAAALKHVTFLERFPAEAVKTNVWGTLSVLRAAAAAGVQRFINISTDKAADPVNVLGYSKRLAEMLTAGFDGSAGMLGISVRFGNVLGSQGSVIPSMEDQIRRGGPVTITHPEVNRYFMTIQEAVQLVLQAGALGEAGEVMVLDMGEPVRIVDLARELIGEIDPGVDIAIEYTGLRPGEKLGEVLSGERERLVRRAHEMIDAFEVPPLPGDALDGLGEQANAEDLKRQLAGLAGATPASPRTR